MNFTNSKKFMDNMADQHTPGNAVEVYLNGEVCFPIRQMLCGFEKESAHAGR